MSCAAHKHRWPLAGLGVLALVGCTAATGVVRAPASSATVRAPGSSTTVPVTGPRAPVRARRRAASMPASPSEVPESERERYWVRCEDVEDCPEAVGMVVTPSEPKAERCTAALVAPDLVLTASHCLPARGGRGAGAACDGTWVAFPGTRQRKPAWRACAQVVAVSGHGQHAVLRQDYALLRLSSPVQRRALEVDPSPLASRAIVTVASVTPHPAIDSRHSLATRLCRVDGERQAVAVLGERARSVGWLTHCPMARGHSGSPVLDRDGRLRAIVHGGTFTGYERGVTTQPPRFWSW